MVKLYSIQPIRNLTGILEEVINFIRVSPKRLDNFRKKITEHCPNLKTDILLKLWIEHHDIFTRFDQILPAVISFLNKYIIEYLGGQILTGVKGLYSSIVTFNFLIIFKSS